MTRNEAIRQTHQSDVLQSLGFTDNQAEQLRRISLTLRRWYERECGDGNGCIERDDVTDIPYWHSAQHDGPMMRIPDREKGALARLKAILANRHARAYVNGVPPAPLSYYLQTDPRGATLYILRPGDVPEGKDASGYYSRGICVY